MPADRFLHRRAGHSVKVGNLSDFEYRVWTQYLLSADDFGLLPLSAVAVQRDNSNLEVRPQKTILKALTALVTVGLLRTFAHQGKTYLYQHDWQDWQKVRWPGRTLYPCPPAEALSGCTAETQRLYEVFPGGDKVPRKNHRGSSEELPEKNESTSEVLPPTRETANGLRLEDIGSPKKQGRLDVAFASFRDTFPENRRKGGHMAEQLFVQQVSLAGGVEPLMAALQNHAASAQWRDKSKIPNMDRWLSEERWRQTLPAEEPRVDTRVPEWAR